MTGISTETPQHSRAKVGNRPALDEQSKSGHGRLTKVISGRAIDASLTLLIVAGTLLIVEYLVENRLVSQYVLPRPTEVYSALVAMVGLDTFWQHTWSTLAGAGLGFLLAACVAIASAALLVTFDRLERVMMPIIVAFQSMPKIAIAPIIILALGFDLSGKVTITAVVSFFPILLNSLAGLRIRNRDHYELLRSLGASRVQIFRRLRLPSSVPYIFAGLHVGIIFALLGTIVAEFVGSRNGLGSLLLAQKAAFNVPGVYAVLVVLCVIGLVFRGAMTFLERKFSFWAEDVSHKAL